MNFWLYAAVDEAVKSDIAGQIAEIAQRRPDENQLAALNDFAGILRAMGIRAIEQAVGSTARGGQPGF